jgi:chromosome partitioning protein
MIVTVANHAPVSGKTAIAENLALLRVRSGRKVILVDTDGGRMCQRWSLDRARSGLRPLIKAGSITGHGFAQELEDMLGQCDDILFDTEGCDTPESRAALIAVHVVVVPLAPEQADLSHHYQMIARLNAARMFNPSLRVLFVATCRQCRPDLAAVRNYAAQVMSAHVAETVVDLAALVWGANVPGGCASDIEGSAGADTMTALFEEVYCRPVFVPPLRRDTLPGLGQ